MYTSRKPNVYLIRIGKKNPNLKSDTPKFYVGFSKGGILYIGSGTRLKEYKIPREGDIKKLMSQGLFKRRIIKVFETEDEAKNYENKLLTLINEDDQKLSRYINVAGPTKNGHMSLLKGRGIKHGYRANEVRDCPIHQKKFRELRKQELINQKQQELQMNERERFYELTVMAAERNEKKNVMLFSNFLFNSKNETTTTTDKEYTRKIEWFDNLPVVNTKDVEEVYISLEEAAERLGYTKMSSLKNRSTFCSALIATKLKELNIELVNTVEGSTSIKHRLMKESELSRLKDVTLSR